jgi:hypothetical protein
MDNKYIIIVEEPNGDTFFQTYINGEIDYLPIAEINDSPPILYEFGKASKFCKESNVSIYSLINGLHYFTKEYEEEI